jgi:hypothetical protein
MKAVKNYTIGISLLVISCFSICALIKLFCSGGEVSDCGICTANGNHWGLMIWSIKVALIGYIIPIICDYRIENPKEIVKMNYTAFRDTYHLNPKAWILPNESEYGAFSKPYLRYVIEHKEYWRSKDTYGIRFSFIDWIKFRYWLICHAFDVAREARVEKAEQDTERLVQILESMQRDVNRAYHEAEKFMKDNKVS